MAVFLTGDTHGSIDVGKVKAFARVAEGRLCRNDYLIILGDFGVIWHDPPSQAEADLLEWYETAPWTTLFVDGNHENFDLLDAMPAEQWHGGRVHRVTEHLLHLMRGERFEIGGHSFFVVGGGHSIDAHWRVPHESWWPQESPSEEERAYIAKQASELGTVDFVLTHVPPTGCYERYRKRWSGFWGPSDEYTDWLESHIEGTFAYKRWFFGHLHFDLPLDTPHTLLFNEVFDLDGTGLTTYGL